ncbi:hypothetical protein V8F33_007051 [Rhypophila sp. PSN 637]
MFSIKSIMAIAAFGMLSASAAPAANGEEASIVARQNTAYVFACQNIRWGTPCTTFALAPGACTNVPSGWNDNISSIRNNDNGRFHCVWYEHGGCGGRSYSNPEDANLADGDGFFNDRISSIRCNFRQFLAAAADTEDAEAESK